MGFARSWLAVAFVFALALGSAAGCTGAMSTGSAGDGSSAVASVAASKTLEPGVVVYQSAVKRAGATVRIWLYMPEGATGKVPAVLIGPAGSPLIYGMRLSEGDREEHLPWVRAGYAVIAYDIEGSVAEDATDEQVLSAVEQFRDAQFGVADAKLALEFALARESSIDPKRVAVVGHSSAAGLALLVAANESRVAACVAFAPATDASEALDAQAMSSFSQAIPGFDAIMRDGSARNAVGKVTCPVFLFHANDDETVPKKSFDAFAQVLESTNKRVSVDTVGTGGHYDSMLDQGIPAAINWTDELFGRAMPGGQ
jgi:dienelactone hydrolase